MTAVVEQPQSAVSTVRTGRPAAVRVGRRSAATMVLASLVGLVAFGWPLVAGAGSAVVAHASDAPWLFAALLPLVLAVVLAEIADGGLDAKGVALLGVLSAVAAALRPFGSGHAGFEPMWIVLVLGGRALGPGFGFCLGAIGMFASALVTGGVGPWLPFQMVGAAWVGLGAGLLPRASGRRELGMLAGYAAFAALAYGFLLNLWFWPFMTLDPGFPEGLSYVPGAPMLENLQHWLLFSATTSLGFDIPRAALAVALVLIAGRPVLTALRRASRRAAFEVPVRFEDADGPGPVRP
ncbi:MAG: ECF transporter S component [Candidatus Nanopelagicales bacterium]|jgi:energy-coupling factor transport system substrate-specific component